ncbi:formate dehydrogenase accessory sulfurtransferase FdhD [Cupriavidus respiraculi]|uniref:formate dehydrogenase accessory sulfurtransferase FdhD n=1 Tax=Cupriavidus respiraculi TaxID=195930 RepID=UPI00398AFC27
MRTPAGAMPEDDAMPPTHSAFAVRECRGGMSTAMTDDIAEEVPVALEYNGISHAVMLATPADLDDFALGFSLCEGIVDTPAQVYETETEAGPAGITVRLRIAAEAFAALKARRRTLAGRTGCGLCGTESLAQVLRPIPPLPLPNPHGRFDAATLHRAFAQLQARQTLQWRTGATHAAAWLDAAGTLGAIREDVGRHNALDKLVGALARAGTRTAGGAVLVTSRASYEMVLKTASAGIGLLAAVSGPTALAVRVAEQAGLTLAGFVRPGRHVVYTHPQRLIAATAHAA